MAAMRSPTVKRRRIAQELRRLREKTGMTKGQAAKALDMSPGNLGRIENREITARPVVVRAALALYGVTGDAAEALIELARGATERGWWHNYSDVMPDWFGFYVGLEEDATQISTYQAEVVPGLFQTKDYARAIFGLTSDGTDTDQKVAARLQRQEILHRENPVSISAVLNEAVLLRPLGSAMAFRTQLEHLAELTALPNVSIQVLPFGAGGHPAMTGPYSLLQFPDSMDEPVVYLENFTQGHVLEEPEHFTVYQDAHDRLRKLALSEQESLGRIRELASSIG
ncbi:helix-turn-helix domain-containing protein [Glycomyces algeriensis]|uniref:Transcriptional regulator n=1 Tax=Glycomyces algeriensis TaxID=256037 RepID=A0A9W6G776_9ACTN|nr:helix-turn-helix transcriptional regulator [Glycomyces algeriensis]MDA1368167.1 helix-turn-helix transcriptional regulator [Glycomyces algeriensis]MDR7348850.1 transcriptional regulator with XRE-family HTH domain [Glycomyces algeriensis]GLI41553.1 transcriptional regulator [Glycomyces algeriensis]